MKDEFDVNNCPRPAPVAYTTGIAFHLIGPPIRPHAPRSRSTGGAKKKKPEQNGHRRKHEPAKDRPDRPNLSRRRMAQGAEGAEGAEDRPGGPARRARPIFRSREIV